MKLNGSKNNVIIPIMQITGITTRVAKPSNDVLAIVPASNFSLSILFLNFCINSKITKMAM